MIQFVVGPEVNSPRLKVYRAQTRYQAAIPVVPGAQEFMGEAVEPDPRVAALLASGRAEVAELAARPLGTSEVALTRTGGRTADSPMGNLLADKLRAAAGTEVGIINAGDVRAGIDEGPMSYEELFRALPKNLRLVKMPTLPVADLLKNIERSVRTCGRRGALQVSGLTIDFSRDCTCPDSKRDADDKQAKVLRLTTSEGRVLYEVVDGEAKLDPRPVSVATTDFVMTGGAGYPGFDAAQARGERVHLRDAIAEQLERGPAVKAEDVARGRYRNVGPMRCKSSRVRRRKLRKQRLRESAPAAR